MGKSSGPRELQVTQASVFENVLLVSLQDCADVHITYSLDGEKILQEAYVENVGTECRFKLGSYPVSEEWCTISYGQGKNMTQISYLEDYIIDVCDG